MPIDRQQLSVLTSSDFFVVVVRLVGFLFVLENKRTLDPVEEHAIKAHWQYIYFCS